MNGRMKRAYVALIPGVLLFCAGIGAGMLNGFLGTGGGIVIVFLLRRLFENSTAGGAKNTIGSDASPVGKNHSVSRNAPVSTTVPASGDASDGTRAAFSAAVVTILVLSLVSAFFYQKSGNLPLTLLPSYLPSALLGGTVGALLLGRLKTAWLNRLFGGVMLLAGICMILKATGIMS